MAHQDYISRPSTSKKKSPYKKKSKGQVKVKAKPFPIKLLFIALLTFGLIGAAAYFLWSIKDLEPAKSPAVDKVKKVVKKNKTSLPEIPKVKWSYVDTLKTKEVEVGKYEVKNKGPYQLQCGSFRTRAQASALKATIAFTGIESQIRQAKGTTGIWYKVILGPYERKRLAEKDKHKLNANKVNGCNLWSWR
jgi:cell division protein FtsN